MSDILSVLAVAAVLSFAAYWYIKFRHVLPMETRLAGLDRAFSRFTSFSKELLDHVPTPDSVEHFTDITNYYLVKLHKAFPDSSLFVFERSGGDKWKLISYIKGFKNEPRNSADYAFDVFEKAVNEGDFAAVDNITGWPSEPVVDLFKGFGVGSFVACPFMLSEGHYRRVMVFGDRAGAEFEPVFPYLKYVLSHLNSIFKTSEKMIAFKKENDQLKSELNAVLHELDAAGSRLIQRAKERKALYEVVTKVTSEEKDARSGTSAILNVVAKIVDADVAACLLFDESKNELVVNPGAYGIQDSERMFYSLPLGNTASASVRTFLTRRPFITDDAQNDPEVLGQYARLWNIRSLMIVPIAARNKVIGVLRVGSVKAASFSQDQLEFLSIIADELAIIIEMITLYESLSKTAQELAQLNRLKDEFLSTVSHELKTPLTTIKGFVSVILSGEVGPLNEQQSNFLTVVDQSVNRLTHLISNLLDLSRLNSKVEMEFQKVSLKDLIRNSVTNLLFKAKEKDIVIASELDKDLPQVMADTKWISQVIDNLLINAIKYSGEGCRVSVSGRAKGEVVVVCVEDNGPGIPAEEQKLIFDKFYRGKAHSGQVPGTGLGLAISKSVVEKHGGKIWLESRPGEGARFFFALPVAKARH